MHAISKLIAIKGCFCCAAVLFAASVAGCATTVQTAPPNMVLAAPDGYVPLTPSTGGPAAQTTAVAAPTPGGLPRSGQYAGTGTVMNNPGALCANTIKITQWFVSGPNVSFGAFKGTIQPDGSLSMQAGITYISGRFVGSRFDGRVWRGLAEGCQYMISVEPLA
jgi:hypothetical protein